MSPLEGRAVSAGGAGQRARSAGALRRTVAWARVSGWSLVILGGISLVFCLNDPLSAGFLISAAVVGNGIVEIRLAARLAGLDRRAPGRLALNQAILGVEIAAYAAWQAQTLDPAALEAVLARPSIASLLEALPPEMVHLALDALPDVLRLLYAIVGVVAVAGCGATALFYRSRRTHLIRLVSDPEIPPLPGRPLS